MVFIKYKKPSNNRSLFKCHWFFALDLGRYFFFLTKLNRKMIELKQFFFDFSVIWCNEPIKKVGHVGSF